MFEISIWELLLVALVALLVIGPEQLPKVAFTIGRWVRYFKNSFSAISSEINSEMQRELDETHPKIDPKAKENQDEQ